LKLKKADKLEIYLGIGSQVKNFKEKGQKTIDYFISCIKEINPLVEELVPEKFLEDCIKLSEFNFKTEVPSDTQQKVIDNIQQMAKGAACAILADAP